MRFLGGVYFAITLIIASAIFVVAGTFIESAHDSHLAASALVYDTVIFKVLLWLYFVNILFAALRRWPFRKGHIPFLLTHLGLLMILGGTLVKAYFGLQGNMLIKEGGGSSEIILAGEEITPPHAHVLNKWPHHTEKRIHWVKGEIPPYPGGPLPSAHVTYKGKTAREVVEKGYLSSIQVFKRDRWTGEITPLEGATLTWNEVPTLKIENYSVPLAGEDALTTFPRGREAIFIKGPDTFLIAQGEEKEEMLAKITPQGRLYVDEPPLNEEPTIVVYGGGRGGYALEWAPEVSYEAENDKEKRLRRETALAISEAMASAEKVAPPLTPFQSDGEKIVLFLDRWERQGGYLFSGRSPVPLDLSQIPPDQLKGAYWATKMLDRYEVEGNPYEKPWNYLITPSQTPTEARDAILEQMMVVAHKLPDVPEFDIPEEKLLSALLRSYGLTFASLVRPSEIGETITFETPLLFEYEPAPLPPKLEEARPLVLVELEGEQALLPYDPYGTGLQTPLLSGKELLHYRAPIRPLGHHIRLSDARVLHYPGTNQPFSYEAEVEVDGEEALLSMNHVYETWDGTRFYLSNITPQDESTAKTVQITVNRDPAKYFLTYPGGMILALGIVLLFTRKK